VVFTTSVMETTFRLDALSALHSQLLILDLIYVAVAQRTYERTAEALELTVRAVDAHRLPEKIPSRKRGRQRGQQ
jgi:DNA-binding MurR/RpiR family transcriptional regulator